MSLVKSLPAISLALTLLVGCKKDPPEQEPVPDPEKPGITFTSVKSANATLQATYLSSIVDSGIIGNITYIQGIAFAEFRNSAGQLATPKEVTAEGTVLSPKQGAFRTYPGQTQGLDFGSIVSWKVTGNQSIPDFTENIAHKVPEIGDVNVRNSIDSSQDLWLGIDMENAFTNLGPQIDSVKLEVIGKLGNLHSASASADSVQFSMKEVNALGKGKGYVRAEAWFSTIKNYNGYEVAFINKGVLIREVWIY